MPVSRVRLPVLATVRAAYQDVFADFPATLRGLSLMLLLTIVFAEVPSFFIQTHLETSFYPEVLKSHAMVHALAETTAPPTPYEWDMFGHMQVVGIILSGIGTLLAVFLFCYMQGWYRQLLLNENKGKLVPLRLGKGERRLIWTGTKVFGIQSLFLFALMMVVAAAFGDSMGKGPPGFDPTPYLLLVFLLALYVQARYSLAYPATVMGDAEAPLQQSANLTRRHCLRIAIGNILAGLPFVVAMLLWAYIPAALDLHVQSFPAALSLSLVMKTGFDFLMFLFVAALSAYHARCYAYLVRSSSSSSLH